jgi:NAD+ synthase (glutamine-hydrolysing)
VVFSVWRAHLHLQAITKIFVVSCGVTPKFKVHGGGHDENIALQNIQARLRMVLSYFFAQLLPWTRGRSGGP